MTALTVYLSSQAASLTTADQLYSVAGSPTTAINASALGTALNWGEITSQGTASAWAAAATQAGVPPSGNGFLWDVTTLQGQDFLAGTSTATLRLATGGAGNVAITADLHAVLYKYNGSTYTLIADGALTGQTIGTTLASFTLSATTGANTSFAVGDKLYLHLLAKVTANTGASTQTIRIGSLSTDTVGKTGATNSQVVTPGYQPSGTVTTGDTAARLRLTLPATRDAAARLRLTPPASKNVATRLRFQAPSHDVAARLSLLQPASSVNSQNVAKQQMVYVYDRTGRFIDVWRDAPLLAGFKESINAATTPLRVQLPRPFDNYDLAGQPGSRGTIAQGNIVQYVLFGPGLPVTGKIRYQGVIDAFQPQISENGEESVVVTITPQSSVIADHGLGGGQLFGQPGIPASYVDPVTMFNWWFQNIDPITGNTYTFPLTLSGTNPSSSGVAFSYPFLNQNLQSVFGTILQMLPANWYYCINADLTVTLQQAPTLPQHTFVIGQHITAPTYMQDWTQLKNVIYYLGSATDTTTTSDLNLPGVQSTAAGGTHLVAIAKGADIATYGERLLLVTDSRVLDQASLAALAAGQLTALDQMQLRTTIRLVDYRGDSRPNIGYDIESLAVGDTCILQDPLFVPTSTHANAFWDVAQWDTDFWTYIPTTPLNQVVTIAALTYNFDSVDLELTNLQPNQSVALSRLRQQFQDFTLI